MKIRNWKVMFSIKLYKYIIENNNKNDDDTVPQFTFKVYLLLKYFESFYFHFS